MVASGKDGGRDSQGVWDGHGHTAVFNMGNYSVIFWKFYLSDSFHLSLRIPQRCSHPNSQNL